MKIISPPAIRLFHALLLVLAVCQLYSNTLESPFILDDSQIFENNPAPVTDFSWQSIRQVGTSRFHSRRFFPNFSFALNYTFGEDDPRGYHWVNIGVHAAAAVTLYFLFSIVLSLCASEKISARRREIAFVAALLWAVHPLQTNAVTYIIQRMTSMAALFYLLAVLCYLRARLAKNIAGGWPLYVLALIFGIMALFSKENSAILPVTLLGCELFLLGPGQPGGLFTGRRLLVGALSGGGFLVICLLILGPDPLARIMEGYGQRDFTLGQRLLTEPRVLFQYLSLLVLPLPARMNFAYDFPVSTGLFSPPQTLLAIVGLVGMAGAVIVLYRRERLTAFAVFWFLVNLVIESSFLPLMLIFEHRMYLPSALLVCAAAAWAYRFGAGNVRLVRTGMIAAVVLLAFFTWQRNRVWQSETSLWQDVVAKSPGLAWGQVNLGKTYAQQGEYALAEQHLHRAIDLDPASGLAYLNLGVMYEKQNRLYEANMMLHKALDAEIADHARLFTNLAIVNFKLGNLKEAAGYAARAIDKRPDRRDSYAILGLTYLKMGDLPQAEEVYLRALEKFPGHGEFHVRLAAVYEKQNRLAQAVEILNRALALRDANPAKAYNQLAMVYWRMKKLEESIRAGQRAIEFDPGLLDAYLTLGISYEDAGRLQEAFRVYEKGWQKGLDMVNIYNNWADHQIKSGNPDRAIFYLQQAVRLAPGRAESHRNLARAYAMKGMSEEANLEEMRANQLAPGR